jgi:adenylate cyclase
MKQPSSLAHHLNSQFYLWQRQHEEAVSELERALALDPNDPNGLALMARALSFIGKPEEAVDFANRAMRLDPQNPAHYLWNIGISQFCMGRFEEAATFVEKALKLNPEWVSPAALLAATYGQLGREREARAALDIYLKKGWPLPGFSPNLQAFMNSHPFKNRQVADRFAEGLIKAGLPGKRSEYYHASKENRLTGEKIKALLFGSTITGIMTGGQQWGWETDKEGRYFFRGPDPDEGGKSIIDGGRIWIDGDMGCNQPQKSFWGLAWCWAVFKNPNGTPERKDEYFFASDLGILPFSPMR